MDELTPVSLGGVNFLNRELLLDQFYTRNSGSFRGVPSLGCPAEDSSLASDDYSTNEGDGSIRWEQDKGPSTFYSKRCTRSAYRKFGDKGLQNSGLNNYVGGKGKGCSKGKSSIPK